MKQLEAESARIADGNSADGSSDLLFIAEIACIHEGDADYLLDLAGAVAGMGANAIKFQIFSAEESVSPDHPDYEYLARIAFRREQWLRIIRACADKGLAVWVDVSGHFSLDVVRAAGPAIAGVKIHSADVDNATVLEGIKTLNVPVAIGCGGTALVDLFELLDFIGPDRQVTMLHGYQSFPKDPVARGGPPLHGLELVDLELWHVQQLLQTFPDSRVGIADHLAGDLPMATTVPMLAAALGATVFEKHVTLDRSVCREDYFSALEPHEFRQMVEGVRSARAATGVDRRRMSAKEYGYRMEMKRTVLASRDLEAGRQLVPSDISAQRTGSYESSARRLRLDGRSLAVSVAKGSALQEMHLEHTVGVFCNARIESSRLPRKALLPFYEEYTTLGYLLKRLVSYPGAIGQVVLATTDRPADDALEEIAEQVGVPCFRGESADVMGRMVQTASAFDWTTLVRVTGDDQFISCEYIQKALRYHLENSLDYTLINGLPIGMACEVLDVRTLRRVHKALANRAQTEYVTWFLDSEWICRVGTLEAGPADRYPEFRVTLDYREDYELMKAVAAACHSEQKAFYIPTTSLIRELVSLQPEWRHREELWPLRRRDVDTRLVYRRHAR